MTPLRFMELNKDCQRQARAKWDDAGTPRDKYWYELFSFGGGLLCRYITNEEDVQYYDEPTSA